MTNTTHKAEMNWSGNYSYRGYTLSKNGRTWDIHDNPTYRNTKNCMLQYSWSLKEGLAKIDQYIDTGKWH